MITGYFLEDVLIISFFLEQKIFLGRDIMMALVQVFCPDCGSKKVVRRGKSAGGKQRYLCRNGDCETKSFMLEYKYDGRKSEVRKKIIETSLNGSGVRDIARVLRISTDTVISGLKKKESLIQKVNHEVLR